MYHQSVKVVQRSKGRSSVAAAAYRSGEKIVDERTGVVHDFSRRSGVDHTMLIGWSGTRSELWNQAEAAERRKDATTAREYEVAIPAELTRPQAVELVASYCRAIRDRDGVALDVGMHDLDGRNPHAHILATTRPVQDGQFGEQKADLEWSDKKRKAHGLPGRKAVLQNTRELWAEFANRALEQAGSKTRIDHRSLAEQGVERPAKIHLGSAAAAMERRGIKTDRGDHNREVAAWVQAQVALAVTRAEAHGWDVADYNVQQDADLERDLPPADYVEAVAESLPEPTRKPAPARSRQNPDFVPTRIRQTDTDAPKPGTRRSPQNPEKGESRVRQTETTSSAPGHDRDQEPRVQRQPWPNESPILLDLAGPFSEPVPLERYGVRLADHGDAIRVASDPAGTPAQIAAALYVESKAKGWDRITFRNLDDEAADRVIEMARQDGKLDVISFDDEKQQRRLEKAAAQEREFSQLVTEIPDDMGDIDFDLDPARPKHGGPSL